MIKRVDRAAADMRREALEWAEEADHFEGIAAGLTASKRGRLSTRDLAALLDGRPAAFREGFGIGQDFGPVFDD